jgi:hypothetical protein
MRKVINILIITLFLFSISFSLEGEGKPGAHFRLGFGAREFAMGGAGTAISEGPLALYWNPALTTIDNKFSFESSMVSLSMDRHLYYALGGVSIGKGATITGGIISAITQDIDERDTRGQKTGEFDYPQHSFCLAFTPAFSKYFNVGVGLRVHRYNLYDVMGSGVSIDVGVSSRPLSFLQLGLFIGDVWSSLQWDSTGLYSVGRDEKFPLSMRLGAGLFTFEDRLIISGEVWKSEGDEASFHLGAEGWILDYLALRGGINHNRINYGAGFEYPLKGDALFYLDYAYIQDNFNINNGHVVSLGIEL